MNFLSHIILSVLIGCVFTTPEVKDGGVSSGTVVSAETDSPAKSAASEVTTSSTTPKTETATTTIVATTDPKTVSKDDKSITIKFFSIVGKGATVPPKTVFGDGMVEFKAGPKCVTPGGKEVLTDLKYSDVMAKLKISTEPELQCLVSGDASADVDILQSIRALSEIVINRYNSDTQKSLLIVSCNQADKEKIEKALKEAKFSSEKSTELDKRLAAKNSTCCDKNVDYLDYIMYKQIPMYIYNSDAKEGEIINRFFYGGESRTLNEVSLKEEEVKTDLDVTKNLAKNFGSAIAQLSLPLSLLLIVFSFFIAC